MSNKQVDQGKRLRPTSAADDAEQAWNRLSGLLNKVRELEQFVRSSPDHQKWLEKLNTAELALNQSRNEAAELREELKKVRRQLKEAEKLKIIDANNSELKRQQQSPKHDSELSQSDVIKDTAQKMETPLQSLPSDIRASDDIIDAPKLVGRGGDARMQEIVAEFTKVKSEMERLMTKYDRQHKQHADDQLAAKTKYLEFREVAIREKQRYEDRINTLEVELRLTKGELHKEQQTRTDFEQRNQTLMREQRQLMSRLSEQDDVIRQRVSEMVALEVLAANLRQENNDMNTAVERLDREQRQLYANINSVQPLHRTAYF